MSRLLIKNAKIILENDLLNNGFILIENEKIIKVGSLDELPAINQDTKIMELPAEHTISPGFIDVHIHGAGGSDTMDATQEALTTMASVLPAEGTTSFLATTITQEKEKIEAALSNAALYQKEQNTPGKAEIIGIHLEGPFINEKRGGAQPRNHILEPDIELFKRWQEAANHTIKLITLAPEKANGYEFIRYLSENGVVASIGHSDAIFTEMEEAVKAGATHVTHLFNGMRGMHHREPGVAGAALLFKELIVEMIADGIHVRPEMIKLALNAKGHDGMILITDSMRAKCLKNGHYDLGGQDVTVENGQALLADGTLAGSILKMKDSIKNMIEFTDITLLEAVRLASRNPAKQLNIYDRKGSISEGKDADLVILDENLEVAMTFCRGIKAFERGVKSS
ncbi:N-acetylglucosamine 6-phosphate deacetylase [Cytobacillus oceanisediminis]|jgi:N-acetylglucosamine-6-phosphate deacetylase|uniref:N-acetylglucosamine-6-phosphate deacetylase n=1 Tax=Cytobacillus oceanisediminis TaxID=665099 RepID=A0A2V2ZZH8_9BACI|nr:N-acetylglucosamine-6-phosphate deacetylase [Cytobacillus oceanisediminis]PWW29538.1 N-acetylglucosamine 6-phosphate deacetylase [Cytobacillus oceanisediminis]